MYKRLQNMRSPRKRQGSIPQRGMAKRVLYSPASQDGHTDLTDTSSSSDNTILLMSNDSDDSSAGVCVKIVMNLKLSTFVEPQCKACAMIICLILLVFMVTRVKMIFLYFQNSAPTTATARCAKDAKEWHQNLTVAIQISLRLLTQITNHICKG